MKIDKEKCEGVTFTIIGSNTFDGLQHRNKFEEWEEVPENLVKISKDKTRIFYKGKKQFVKPFSKNEEFTAFKTFGDKKKEELTEEMYQEIKERWKDVLISDEKLKKDDRPMFLIDLSKKGYSKSLLQYMNKNYCDPSLSDELIDLISECVYKDDYLVKIPPLKITNKNIDEYCKKIGLSSAIAKKFKKGKIKTEELETMREAKKIQNAFEETHGFKIKNHLIMDSFKHAMQDFTTNVDENKCLSWKKNDKEKIQPSLIEPEFIEKMAEVLTIGAKKYGLDNWKKCEDKKRYKDALLRHILSYLKGEEKDKETGLSHLHHAACNLMFLGYLENEK